MKSRLLVVELHHLGDAVMSLPFVRGAQPHYDVHVLCRPVVAPVYRLLGEAPQIHEWEPPWTDDSECGAIAAIQAAKKMGKKLEKFGFDTAVCVWSDARAEILMQAAEVKKRIGFPMTRRNYYAPDIPWRAKRLRAGQLAEIFFSVAGPARPLLTAPLHRADDRQHHSRCWEQAAQVLDMGCENSVPWISVEPSRHVSALRGETASGRKLLLCVHAHARLPSKQWSQEKWRVLCSLPAIREKFRLLEIIPPGAKAVIDGIDHVATDDAKSLASVLAAADALVCHDSFPAHLASALGKPVVTVFGSGEPDWFAPWHNRERVVQRRVCPLHPCIDRCGMDSYLCLDAVAVDDVAREVMKLADNK